MIIILAYFKELEEATKWYKSQVAHWFGASFVMEDYERSAYSLSLVEYYLNLIFVLDLHLALHQKDLHRLSIPGYLQHHHHPLCMIHLKLSVLLVPFVIHILPTLGLCSKEHSNIATHDLWQSENILALKALLLPKG